MSGHDQRNGRPIHPECPKLDDAGLMCDCHTLWHEWDGRGIYIARQIEVADRMDMRTTTPVKGRGPDADEVDSSKPDRESVPAGEDYDGFWKHSEWLKCRQGVKMKDLDMSRFVGGTWDRAAEVDKL